MNTGVFYSDQLKQAIRSYRDDKNKTEFMSIFSDLFGSLGPEEDLTEQKKIACSVTNFVRLLAFRYITLQNKGFDAFLSSLLEHDTRAIYFKQSIGIY